MKSAMLMIVLCVGLLGLLVNEAKHKSEPANTMSAPSICRYWDHDLERWLPCKVGEWEDPVPVSNDESPIVWIGNRETSATFRLTAECRSDEEWCGDVTGNVDTLVFMGQKDVACLADLKAASKAIDKYIPKFIDPVERRRTENSHIRMNDLFCRSPWCGGEWHDTRSIEERLADDRRRYERGQEELGAQIVQDERERFAYRQWAEVKKECWRQP